MDVSTHDLTYCHHRERGLIQHCPWKTLCCSLPTPAPSNPVLAHCRCDCRVSQNRATRETTVDKLRDQSGIESLIVHANKGEEMVEGQEPAQGQNPFGCNLSRSGSCCLGKLLQRGFMMCLNRSRSRISPRKAFSPCHGTGMKTNAETPNTKCTAMDRGTFCWQLIFHQFAAL